MSKSPGFSEFNPVNSAENFNEDTYIEMMNMWQDYESELLINNLCLDSVD
jgi:hypothetical protein